MLADDKNSSKLSVNSDKTKYILFQKVRQKDNIPLVLPTLKKHYPYKASRLYQLFRSLV